MHTRRGKTGCLLEQTFLGCTCNYSKAPHKEPVNFDIRLKWFLYNGYLYIFILFLFFLFNLFNLYNGYLNQAEVILNWLLVPVKTIFPAYFRVLYLLLYTMKLVNEL